jgi:hypothetical protein
MMPLAVVLACPLPVCFFPLPTALPSFVASLMRDGARVCSTAEAGGCALHGRPGGKECACQAKQPLMGGGGGGGGQVYLQRCSLPTPPHHPTLLIHPHPLPLPCALLMPPPRVAGVVRCLTTRASSLPDTWVSLARPPKLCIMHLWTRRGRSHVTVTVSLLRSARGSIVPWTLKVA